MTARAEQQARCLKALSVILGLATDAAVPRRKPARAPAPAGAVPWRRGSARANRCALQAVGNARGRMAYRSQTGEAYRLARATLGGPLMRDRGWWMQLLVLTLRLVRAIFRALLVFALRLFLAIFAGPLKDRGQGKFAWADNSKARKERFSELLNTPVFKDILSEKHIDGLERRRDLLAGRSEKLVVLQMLIFVFLGLSILSAQFSISIFGISTVSARSLRELLLVISYTLAAYNTLQNVIAHPSRPADQAGAARAARMAVSGLRPLRRPVATMEQRSA